MSLPNLSVTAINFREVFLVPKVFKLNYLKKHHVLFAVEIVTLSLAGLALAVIVLSVIGELASKPEIVNVYPANIENKAAVSEPITVNFNHPVNQNSLKAEITPTVEGNWVFSQGNGVFFEKKLVFEPDVTLQPDTTYSVSLINIQPVSGLVNPYNYSFSFRTKKLPGISSDQKLLIGPNDNVVINLDTANDHMADFSFSFSPTVDFSQNLSQDNKQYILTPSSPLKQGSNYQLTIVKTAVSYNLKTNKRIERASVVYDLKTKKVVEGVQPSPEKSLNFLTLSQPTILSVSSKGDAASTGPITINFDKEMDKYSVASLLSINPKVDYTLNWADGKTLTLSPNKTLPFGTNYQLTFTKGTKATDSTFFENDFVNQFTTIGNVKVSQFTPSNGSKTAAIGSKIYTTFNQTVDKQSAQSNFTISPTISGSFSWNQNMMIFTPTSPFPYSTTYNVTIKSGVKSLTALDSITEFKTTFTTASLYEVVKLTVPIVKQKYSLSCEFANMKMALAYKGVNKSEDELIAETPFDNTPHSGDIWGDPALGFVGNYNGTYFGDGYGAYYPVIVNEISKYRPAEAHVGWNVASLLAEVKAGNPVIIWSCLVCHNPRYWNTPDSRQIYAYEYYHMMTVVGYTGTVDNPQSIVLNDSYSGRQISYSKSQFSSRWSIMNNTAVVVK